MSIIPIEIDNKIINSFNTWDGNAYSNAIFRSAVDAIARNIGKLRGAHYITDSNNNKFERDQKLNRILQIEPNPLISSYDLLYKIATHYYLYNNAFILVDFDNNHNIQGLYPIDAVQAQVLSDSRNNIYIAFRLKNGKEFTFRYSDVIHLKRHFNNNLLFGDSNDPINLTLDVSNKQNEGLINSIESSATIRGVITTTQILNNDDLLELKDLFKENYLSVQNDGGVIVTDQRMEYIPLETKPATIDENQLNAVKNSIYSYLGVTQSIVNSSYTENEWASFYEGVIEPFATQLSLEFTRKIFTEREIAHGNSIQFDAGRLMFASANTKLNLIRSMIPSGLLTINEAREILNLSPIEGEEGNKRFISLNNIDSEIMQDYQKNKSEQ